MEMKGIAPGFGELPVHWWRRLLGKPETYERNCCGSVDEGIMETQRKPRFAQAWARGGEGAA